MNRKEIIRKEIAFLVSRQRSLLRLKHQMFNLFVTIRVKDSTCDIHILRKPKASLATDNSFILPLVKFSATQEFAF